MIRMKPDSLDNLCMDRIKYLVFMGIENSTIGSLKLNIKGVVSTTNTDRKRKIENHGGPLYKRRRVRSVDTEDAGNTNSTCSRNDNRTICAEDGNHSSSIKRYPRKRVNVQDASILLKCYLTTLPTNLWNILFKHICDEMNQRIIGGNDPKFKIIFTRILEIFFCSKLDALSVSSTWRQFEEDLLEKLRHCYRMRELLINRICDETHVTSALPSLLPRFHNLRSLQLAAENKRHSFHWAVDILSKHGTKLENLKLSYCWKADDNSQIAGNGSSNQGISKLVACRNLRNLTLLHFGSVNEFDDAKKLLVELPRLTYFYHKDLFDVLFHIRRKERQAFCSQLKDASVASGHPNPIHGEATHGTSKTSASGVPREFNTTKSYENFRKLDFYYRFGGWYSQRVYTCSEGDRAVSELCPKVERLSLVAPRDLDQLLRNWRIRELFIIQGLNDESIVSSLCTANTACLTSLTLTQMTVTHTDISNIAFSCQSLDTFKVFHASISGEGNVYTHRRPIQEMADGNFRQICSSPFPKLTEACFIEPEFNSFSNWSFGNSLLKLFFIDSPNIQCFELHSISDSLNDIEVQNDDVMSETSVLQILSHGSLKLRHLKLKLSGLAIESSQLAACVGRVCPSLETLVYS